MNRIATFGHFVAIAASVALAACASPPPPSWIDTLGTAPPIVLRLAEAPLHSEALPAPGGQLGGHVWSGAMLGLAYALPTLGTSLVLVPMGVAEGARQAGRAAECAERWRAAVGDSGKWLTETLAPVAPLAVMEAELTRLALKPPPAIVFEREAATADARAQALRTIGERLAARTLIVGEVSILLERAETSSCGVRFTGVVRLQAYERGEPLARGPRYAARASHEDADAQIEAWAANPEIAREQLRRMLQKLAAEVVSRYPWR